MIITFDIGGTSIKYGVASFVNDELVFEMKSEIETHAKAQTATSILNNLKLISKKLMETYAIEGIGISTAGMVDVEKGSIIYSSNIEGYTGTQLKNILESSFNLPVWVENDVNSAALGETMYGAGKGASSSFMVTIGTGIGGAIVVDGNVYHGFSGVAGEVCFMQIKNKTYQQLCSTTSLVQKVEAITNENNLNGRIIFDRAKNGDEICVSAIDSLCEDIVIGLNNCICLVNPEVVILGGGIMSQATYLRPIMDKYMKKHVNEIILKDTKLEFAKLQNAAGMAGAAAFWLNQERKS